MGFQRELGLLGVKARECLKRSSVYSNMLVILYIFVSFFLCNVACIFCLCLLLFLPPLISKSANAINYTTHHLTSIKMNNDTPPCVFCFFCSNYSTTQMWTIVLQLIQLHAPSLPLEKGVEAGAPAAER